MSGRLVCEFAYIRQEETESDEVNRFPFGQTHVDFVKTIFRGIAATVKRDSPGDCIRVANIKLIGRQYYSLTALNFSPRVPKFSRCITTLRAVARSYSKQQNPTRITTSRVNTQQTKVLPGQKVSYSIADRGTIMNSLISVIILVFLAFITRTIPILNTTRTGALTIEFSRFKLKFSIRMI